MKNLIFFTLCSLFTIPLFSQVSPLEIKPGNSRYGVKFSTSIITANHETITLINASELTSQKLQLSDATTQYAVGFWGQKRFGWLYADANVMYSQYGMNFKVYSANSDEVQYKTMQENFKYMDLQIMGGINIHGFRVGVGPVAHILVGHNSDLVHVENIHEQLRTVSYGFSGALGYDTGRFSFDIKFDKAFRTVGDHLYYGYKKTKFLETPDTFTMSVAYAIFK